MEILSYILLFYIGFYYYRLAENHNKNKWLFGFIGIAIFVIAYFFYVLFCRFSYSEETNLENLPAIGVKSFCTGLIITILVFQILNSIWSRKKKNYLEVDEIGKSKNELKV